MDYKRIFESASTLEQIEAFVGSRGKVRRARQGDAFVLEVPDTKASRRFADAVVDKFRSEPATAEK